MLWDLPNTLIGLFLVLITKSKYQKTHYPAFVFKMGGWLKKYMTKHSFIGITFGHIVFVATDDPVLVSHELIHVYQNQILGPFFFPVYLFATIVAWLTPGQHYYRDNFLEKWAYNWQGFWRKDR